MPAPAEGQRAEPAEESRHGWRRCLAVRWEKIVQRGRRAAAGGCRGSGEKSTAQKDTTGSLGMVCEAGDVGVAHPATQAALRTSPCFLR